MFSRHKLYEKDFNPLGPMYSAVIDFRRQILTSKVDHRDVRLNISIMAVDP